MTDRFEPCYGDMQLEDVSFIVWFELRAELVLARSASSTLSASSP
jgi:hypothetical protein